MRVCIAVLLLRQLAAVDVDLNRWNEQLGHVERGVARFAKVGVLGLVGVFEVNVLLALLLDCRFVHELAAVGLIVVAEEDARFVGEREQLLQRRPHVVRTAVRKIAAACAGIGRKKRIAHKDSLRVSGTVRRQNGERRKTTRSGCSMLTSLLNTYEMHAGV